MPRILINTRTSGKVREENINGRAHLVTTMMPIRGDITMNGIFYPDAQVANSFSQLDNLPAPLGHPQINGINVSAFHPVATNAHNVGGFIRKPRKKGKRVFNDFCIDLEVAKHTEDGVEVVRRMNAKEKIGVSTGLTIANVTNEQGEDDFGKAFNQRGEGFTFDHVAILLNEMAAGEHAGTELVLNEGTDNEILVYNFQANELSSGDIHEQLNDIIRIGQGRDVFTWVREVFPDSKTFVYRVEMPNALDKLYKQTYAVDSNDEISLLGDRQEVEQKTEFIPTEPTTNKTEREYTMNKDILILAVIANAANPFTMNDKAKLEAMDESALVNALCTPQTEETARNALTDFGFDFDGHAVYLANEKAFNAFLAAEKERLGEMIGVIVENSEYTAEELEGKDEAELLKINGMLDKSIDRLEPGVTVNTQSSEAATACDYS